MSVEITATPDMVDQATRSRIERVEYWRFIPIEKCPDEKTKLRAHRLNALASLYYFIKIVLRKHRLTEHLHKPICDILESWHLKEVLEIPRDHFKSTICSEGAAMWWALPFDEEDEKMMRALGYGDNWINWMKRAHDQNTRTLLISENVTNAAKLGRRISLHYESNTFFRGLFPEVLPNEQSKWTETSMSHLRTRDASPQGEGTYDFIGVGGALQSRHYVRVIQDDLVGRKALGSEAVMESTIEYHKLVVGAFDSSTVNAVEDNDEIIVGNRWSDRDLGAYLRENEPYFRFHNHSAMGGCCTLHPAGMPIFPEEFSVDKLMRWKSRLGTYLFSCQFLNDPTTSGSARYKEEYLNYFNYEIMNPTLIEQWDDVAKKFAYVMVDPRVRIIHETKQGHIVKDIMPSNLATISMVVDPAHADGATQNIKRCRHAITVTGVFRTGTNKDAIQRVYLLDVWAKECTYEELITEIYSMAFKWKLREFHLETIAAQKLLKFHLDYRNRVTGSKLRCRELVVDRSANAKHRRIQSFDPIYENGQFFCRRNQLDFINEFLRYPHGKTVDILDTLGYAPQTWGATASQDEVNDFLNKHKNLFATRRTSSAVTGY